MLAYLVRGWYARTQQARNYTEQPPASLLEVNKPLVERARMSVSMLNIIEAMSMADD
jgi:hypothetical protein